MFKLGVQLFTRYGLCLTLLKHFKLSMTSNGSCHAARSDSGGFIFNSDNLTIWVFWYSRWKLSSRFWDTIVDARLSSSASNIRFGPNSSFLAVMLQSYRTYAFRRRQLLLHNTGSVQINIFCEFFLNHLTFKETCRGVLHVTLPDKCGSK